MKWISIKNEFPPRSENFLCLFHEKIHCHVNIHYYICHIIDGMYHCRLRPYEDCWNININLLVPMYWMPLPESPENKK